jgi:predicted S18 family serine protease
VYDTNAYLHGEARHPDTVTSNVVANRLVRSITGSDVAVIDMTSARSGGPSGGLTRAIAYLNVVSDGAFTGELRVAATGQIDPDGYLRGIEHIDAKTAAASLADVDVLFTPTVPTSNAGDAPAARIVGEIARDTTSGDSFHDPDRLRTLRQWGATRPAGMDVVDVRHVIDVSAYMCGAGSAFACEVTEVLERQARERHTQLTETARSENERFAARAVGR